MKRSAPSLEGYPIPLPCFLPASPTPPHPKQSSAGVYMEGVSSASIWSRGNITLLSGMKDLILSKAPSPDLLSSTARKMSLCSLAPTQEATLHQPQARGCPRTDGYRTGVPSLSMPTLSCSTLSWISCSQPLVTATYLQSCHHSVRRTLQSGAGH